jgi:putative ABC transport system permease protein
VIRYFFKAMGVHFRAGRTLFFLGVFGVALGVASVLSIQIINRNALGAFEGSMLAVSGEADLMVVGRTPTLPDDSVASVLAAAGVEAAWPLYRVDVAVTGRPEFYLEVLGVDLFAPVRLPWEGDPVPVTDILGRPGWAAVTPALASDMGWTTGSKFEVSSGSRRVTLEVGALVDFQRVTPLASRRMIVMDIAQVQSLLGRKGRVHQIDVRAVPGTDLEDLRSRLEARLEPAARVLTPVQRRQETAGLVDAFRMNLTALSLVSVFVGGFLVYSSTQAALVRRREEFGLLRSLGTSRRSLLGLILGEVAVLGVLGTALGAPLGYLAARHNVDVVSATLTNLYLLEGIETLVFPWWMAVVAVAVGLGGAMGGALLPAADMARRHPRDLLAAYSLHERFGTATGRLFAIGCGLLAASWAGYLAFGRGWRPAGFLLGVALLGAIPLLSPLVVHRLASAFRPVGFSLAYGARSLRLRIQTTSMAVAALAVAVSMLVGITVMVGSFRRTLEVWLDSTTRADVYITTESWRPARDEAVLRDGMVEELEAMPGVRMVDRLRQFFGYTGNRRISLGGVPIANARASPSGFHLLAGNREEAIDRAEREGAVLISEPLARKEGLAVGDRLRLHTLRGEVELPIVAIYYDYSSELGSAVMDLATMEEYFGPGKISNVALYLEPGVDPERMVDRLKSLYADEALWFRSNRRLREDVFAIFEQTFAVTRLLQAMGLLIAVCGITLTLLVLARERIAELALYRALGATRRQIFRVFVGKGLGMAVFGLALGLVGGVGLALLLVFIINRAYFGWTIAVHWPWATIAGQAGTIVAAAAAASLYPAARASATPATELSREDL